MEALRKKAAALRHRHYSVDRLQHLYARLLSHIIIIEPQQQQQQHNDNNTRSSGQQEEETTSVAAADKKEDDNDDVVKLEENDNVIDNDKDMEQPQQGAKDESNGEEEIMRNSKSGSQHSLLERRQREEPDRRRKSLRQSILESWRSAATMTTTAWTLSSSDPSSPAVKFLAEEASNPPSAAGEAAFELLAATRSTCHGGGAREGGGGGGGVRTTTLRGAAVEAFRDANVVVAWQDAQAEERAVVQLVRDIGSVVVQAQAATAAAAASASSFRRGRSGGGSASSSSLRSDETFEYFCEKNILSLLVDIVKEKPRDGVFAASASLSPPSKGFRGVVWSAVVKAQVFSTVSLLISNLRNVSALYYLFSQNSINQLVASMMPLQQWTDPAMEIMLPAYVDLLKHLALQLGESPGLLFPLFTTMESNQTLASFSLFSATLETGTSTHAQSHSFVHATCLNLLADLMQVPYPPLQDWVYRAQEEQGRLAAHLCELILRCHRRMAHLTTGPVVDATRHGALGGQLRMLDDHVDAINDVCHCAVRGFNVRMCEALLRRVVAVLGNDLLPCRRHYHRPGDGTDDDNNNNEDRHFLAMVGVLDADVVPSLEGRAQAATCVLARLFVRLAYPPLVRMLAVALFHVQSTPRLMQERTEEAEEEKKQDDSSDAEGSSLHENSSDYVLTPELNAIAQGTYENGIENLFRTEIFRALSGMYGEWRSVSAAVLVENAIRCEALDDESLFRLDLLLPSSHATPARNQLEMALVEFLELEHTYKSVVTINALECMSSLAMQMMHKTAVMVMKRGNLMSGPQLRQHIESSRLWKALQAARTFFFRRTLQTHEALGVSEIFLDLLESAVRSRYKRVTVNIVQGIKSGPRIYAYILSQHGCAVYGSGASLLVRKLRGATFTDVEATRFFAQMAIHFRAVCRILQRFMDRVEKMDTAALTSSPSKERPLSSTTASVPPLDAMDTADDLALIFASLRAKPTVGTAVDLHGRMAFPFTPGGVAAVLPSNSDDAIPTGRTPLRIRGLAGDIDLRGSSRLILVLDPADLLVVKPRPATRPDESRRGTVLVCIPLLNVIAAAADGAWLHIAVRHQENVSNLLKNGNIAMKFDGTGTSLIVRQYLDRCRHMLRGELKEQIIRIFEGSADHDSGDGKGAPPQHLQEQDPTQRTNDASATAHQSVAV